MSGPRNPALDSDAVAQYLDDLTEHRRVLRNKRQNEWRRAKRANDLPYREREYARIRIHARERYRKMSTVDRLMKGARARAKRDGVKFDLSAEYLRTLWPEDARCPILGFRMVRDRDRDEAPSLDRIDPEGGYVMGNVRIISTRANRLKADAHAFELDRIAAYLRSPEPLTFVYKGEDR